MNLRRGFLRLWVTATGSWLIYCIWYYKTTCHHSEGEGILCEDRSRAIGPVGGGYSIGGPMEQPDLLHIAAVTIGLPLAILGAGLVAGWVNPGVLVTGRIVFVARSAAVGSTSPRQDQTGAGA